MSDLKKQIEELRALEGEATPGPWEADTKDPADCVMLDIRACIGEPEDLIAWAITDAAKEARQAGREEAIREIRAAKKKQLVFCGKWKGKDEFQYSLHTYALGVLVDLHDALSKLSTPTDKE